jgi:hypothetical protein
MSETERTLYSTDGEGHWVKRVWSKQCSESIMFSRRCQGVEGHEGNHWCYAEDGSYHYDVPGDLEPHDIAGGMTPPGHKSWISPVDKADDYYMGHYTDTEITDPDEIARLEADDVPEGASITGPVKWDELDEEDAAELKRRMEAYDRAKEK